MMRYSFGIFALATTIIACTGCTYWRQLSQPPTWGMSVPEMWQYESVQAEKQKLTNPTIRITDLQTGAALANTQVNAIPRSGLSPIGRPKFTRYLTNSNGIVTLKNLPSGVESWISLDGFTPFPIAGLLDDGQTKTANTLIELVDPSSDAAE